MHFSLYKNHLLIFWLCWVFLAAHRLSLVVVSGVILQLVVRGLLIAVAPPVVEHGLQGILASVTAACGCSGHSLEQWDPPGLRF